MSIGIYSNSLLQLFSQDRRKFLEESIPQIGEPPISRHEAFRLLIPGYHQPAAPPMFDPILYKHLMTQGASTSAIPASLFELFAVQLPQLQAPPLVPTLPITTIQQQRLSPLLPSTSAGKQ